MAELDDSPNPDYRSTERVYTKDDDGNDLALLYAVGDEIPVEEAERQGLVGKRAAKKAAPAKKAATKKAAAPAAQAPSDGTTPAEGK